MTAYIKTPRKEITRAAEAVLYFRDHPEDLPTNAPEPQKDAHGFADWWNTNGNKVVRMTRVQP